MSENRTLIPYPDDAVTVSDKSDSDSSDQVEAVMPSASGASEEITSESNAEQDKEDSSDSSAESEIRISEITAPRKIAVWLFRSVITLSCAVFLLTAGTGLFGLVKSVDRDELLSKITGALLATVFGRAEIVNVPPVSDNGETYESDAAVETLGADTAEIITEEIREIDLTLKNETPYTPDMNALLLEPRIIPTADELYAEYGPDAPLVLLLHTHATEGYSDSADSGYRTEDTARNVVAIGDIIEEKLTDAGINTIHCETLFDADDFTMAYYNASLEIKRVIAQYPSVSYIIDIHRDSIETSEGEYYAPTASIEGVKAAQLMFVIGTDYGGSGHSTWENNLSLAARIQADISSDHPTLMRNINLRSASFNEQYSDGSFLLEVGSCASDFDEAALGAEIFADYLIEEIIG